MVDYYLLFVFDAKLRHLCLSYPFVSPGYLIYDMIHYYLHYGSPSLNNALGKYLYHIKRYHYQHHFVHHDKGEYN